MPIAYWCLLVVVLLPYFLSLAARSQVARSEYVRDPRAFSESLVGWRRRAHQAHLNAFEATPALLAGLFVAELMQVPRPYTDGLAVAFVSFRLLHAAFYLTDRPVLRSHAWRLGILCVLALFVMAAVANKAVGSAA
jgi:uncharacterized MAPEG superfamily protein